LVAIGYTLQDFFNVFLFFLFLVLLVYDSDVLCCVDLYVWFFFIAHFFRLGSVSFFFEREISTNFSKKKKNLSDFLGPQTSTWDTNKPLPKTLPKTTRRQEEGTENLSSKLENCSIDSE
jgi:hypothetical protein